MSELRIDVVPVTQWVQNCMVITPPDDGPSVVVDPGGDLPDIRETIGEREVAGILVTHGHIDHIGGLAELAAETRAPVWFHPDDLWLFEDPSMGHGRPSIPVPERSTHVADGDTVSVAGLDLTVLHTPGHSPGHVCYLLDRDERSLLIGGDLLFMGSIGRTDLPRGDFQTLVDSVRTKIWPLDDETLVLPGHGPTTKVGREKQTNPFVGVEVIGRR